MGSLKCRIQQFSHRILENGAVMKKRAILVNCIDRILFFLVAFSLITIAEYVAQNLAYMLTVFTHFQREGEPNFFFVATQANTNF